MQYFFAALLILFVIAAGVFWHISTQQHLYSQPDTGATLRTANLIDTAQSLRNTFGQTADRYDSSKNSTEYLRLLNSFQNDCRAIAELSDQTKGYDERSAIAQYLAKSKLLCDELVNLSKEGAAITESILPLLKENAQLKRYETIPFIAAQIRERHEQKVQSTLDQTMDKLKFIKYKTETRQYVVQLNEAMKANSGMTYLGALSIFQQNAYAERQRYWNSEADLGSLIRALEISLDRYCKYLSDKDITLSVCKDNT
jgi:hypothetical protein